MADRVKWTEVAPKWWHGRVDGTDVYLVLELEPGTSDHAGAWVSRRGARDGFRMTNVERAKDIAELQETMDPLLLHKRGLLLQPA